MRSSLTLLVVFALVLLFSSCTMIDVRMSPSGGVHSHAFVNGYVDAGWPASESLLQVGLFDGPSRGALLYVQVWKLLRFEVGFLGMAVGVGPLDGGVGVLLYDPHPPAYIHREHGEHEDDECCEDEGQDDDAADAKDSTNGAAPFVYKAY